MKTVHNAPRPHGRPKPASCPATASGPVWPAVSWTRPRKPLLFEALEWLEQRHGAAVEAALRESFFGVLDAGLYDDLLHDFEVRLNAADYLVAEGELVVGGRCRPVASLLLEGFDRRSVDLAVAHGCALKVYEVCLRRPGMIGVFEHRWPLEEQKPFWVETLEGEDFQSPGLYGLRVLPGLRVLSDGMKVRRRSAARYQVHPADLLGVQHDMRTIGVHEAGAVRDALLRTWLLGLGDRGAEPRAAVSRPAEAVGLSAGGLC